MMKQDESLLPNRSAVTPTPTTPLPLPPTPPRNRPSTPESPTPQRGPALAPSPPPLAPSPPLSSPTPAARLPLRNTPPPIDLARQIAAVTEDLAGLRAEEQRLSQIQHDRVRLASQFTDTAFRLTFSSRGSRLGSSNSSMTRYHALLRLHGKTFGAYYS